MTTYLISATLLRQIVDDYCLLAVSLDRIGVGDRPEIGNWLKDFMYSTMNQRISDRRSDTWELLTSELNRNEVLELEEQMESLPYWTSRNRPT